MAPPIKGIRKITQEDLDFAAGLLNQGESADSVRAKLMERNLTEANANAVIEQLYVQAIYSDAAQMLQAGQPPEQVKQALIARGLSEENASTVVDNLLAQAQGGGTSGGSPVRMVIGGIIVAIGIGLWIGNMTGVFPTFPFAGILTILVGGAIAGSGQKS